MGHRHRSRSHHSHQRSSSPLKRNESYHRHHHKHKKQSEEHELRKKQERLAKARLMLLQEAEQETPEILNQKVEKQEEKQENQLRDELEIGVDEVVTNNQNTDEADSLDLYMMEIDKQAFPQEKTTHSDCEEVQENLDDDEYYEKFIEKFYKVQECPKEPENKPEVLYDDEADMA